jgi:hypothetical protein
VVAAASCASATQADADVRLVIGGMFEVDHLGPFVYNAVVARVRAEPACHVATLLHIASAFDAARLSHTYPSALLERVAGLAPEDVRQAARTLSAMHQRALAAPPADAYQRFRLERSIRTLALFLD